MSCYSDVSEWSGPPGVGHEKKKHEEGMAGRDTDGTEGGRRRDGRASERGRQATDGRTFRERTDRDYMGTTRCLPSMDIQLASRMEDISDNTTWNQRNCVTVRHPIY
jgi:hypothetical protein